MERDNSIEINKFCRYLQDENDIGKLLVTKSNIQVVIKMSKDNERRAILAFKVNKINQRIKDILNGN